MTDKTSAGFSPEDISSMSNAKAQGKRPDYFLDPMSEQHFSMTMALMAELAAARERIDSLERVLADKGLIDINDVEAYKPDASAGQARQLAQVEFSARVFRPLQQSVEAMSGIQPSMDEMASKLGKDDA